MRGSVLTFFKYRCFDAMIEIFLYIGVGLVLAGLYFTFAQPYTRQRSYVRSKPLSGEGNNGVVLIILGLLSIVFTYYAP